MAGSKTQVVVFYWPGSPWASKVVAYLNFRKIPYLACHQPITMPRPDLAALGVAYRRIPVVAIGRDVYCDTSLQIAKLNELFPPSAAAPGIEATTGEHKALELLLEKWTNLSVFGHAADLIPLDHPLLKDPKFIKDRTELWGEDWSREAREPKRAPALVAMRELFSFLEDTLLADGREWALKTPSPSLADIHGAWIFEWMYEMDGAFDKDIISESIFPKTWAWLRRYAKAVEAASNPGSQAEEIDGAEAEKRISGAEFAEAGDGVDKNDPLRLKAGQTVQVAPVDTGTTAIQKGELVGISKTEVVVGAKTKSGADIRVHQPRCDFKVVGA